MGAPSTTTGPAPVFYSLPAEHLEAGMSTDDGQDILATDIVDGQVLFDVYTPADDPRENEDRQCCPEGRMQPVGERVELAVFPDTEVDATTHEHAIVHEAPSSSPDVFNGSLANKHHAKTCSLYDPGGE